MAKNKRKATSTVARRQDALPAPIAGPKDHDHDGDGLEVIALTVVTAIRPDAVPCAPCLDPSPLPSSQPRDVGFSALHPASVMVVAFVFKSLDAVLVEDCSVASDDEILDEDQLDFNFSDEECDDSPQALAMLPTKNLPSLPPLLPTEQIPSPPLTKSVMPSSLTSGCREPAPSSVAGNPLSAPSSSQWQDLFFSNKSTVSYTKLQNFSLNHLSKTYVISPKDIQPKFKIWNFCVVGYVSGKSPGYRALNSIISNVWKCEATLTIHDFGWLVYKFKTEEDKLTVLRGGPYLVYGRPLVLRPMMKVFHFSSEEMSRVPVWVKFPNLPLCCWSPVCLSKIASILGKPIQCDQLTSTLSRMSYARVLVEIDLLEELRHLVEISLPEGLTLHQKVVYETLPKYCNFCHVLGHTRLLCLKATSTIKTVPCNQPQNQDVQADKGMFLVEWVPSLLFLHLLLHRCNAIPKTTIFQWFLGGDAGSEADHVITNGWVVVHFR